MQISDNPLMEAYKTIRLYGTIESDRNRTWKYGGATHHSRTLVICYQEQHYLVMMLDGDVTRLESI